MQQRNLILFIILSFLILIGSFQLQHWLWPQPDKKQAEKPDAKGAVEAPKPKAQAKRIHLPRARPKVGEGIALGSGDSKIRAILDPWGGGVRSVTDNQFQMASDMGKPVVDQNGQPAPMELVPAEKNLLYPSYVLYHYDPKDDKANRPLSTLGQTEWEVLEPNPVVPGRTYDRVVFAATVGDVRITKTFTLGNDDYHIGLEVKTELIEGKHKGPRTEHFRYQVAGAHGLRMEGIWYTPTHQDALILRVDSEHNDRVERTKEDLHRLSVRGGGDEVTKGDGKIIRYAVAVTQYFASGIVVDDQQADGIGQDFLARARPTVERAWIEGKIEEIAKDGRSFVLDTTPEPGLFSGTPKKETRNIVLGPGAQLPDGVREGSRVAVSYTLDDYDQMLALDIQHPGGLNQHFDEIAVRVSTEEFKLEPGKPVVHKYLLYNGPVKVRLLSQLAGDKAVPPELVERYETTLRLDTFTDYQSNGPFGWIASSIGWTKLLIICTNFMHGILWGIHHYLGGLNYGLCIILLTLLVRAAMFPLSRKQTLAAQRMQDKMAKLKPEIAKLKEKYKNDPQGQKQAQTELMLRHGMINPLGSCWVMLLQMPIFMGLYYALQESIHFRLAPFAWIENLAAPDMLIRWGQSIPIISSSSNYSGGLLSMLYLGPFFNLLPIIAVAFMIVQQRMMMPPPTDEQTASQQKMMKYMTVFFGLLFYKVAAGLCIYFIVSSVWGYCERKLLPKKQTAGAAAPPEAPRGRFSRWMLDRLQAMRDDTITGSAPAANTNGATIPPPDSRREKRNKPKRPPVKSSRNGAGSPNGDGILGKLRAWWSDLLKAARKK